MNKIINDFLEPGRKYYSTLNGGNKRKVLCVSKKRTNIFFEHDLVIDVKGKPANKKTKTVLIIPPSKYSDITRARVDGNTLYLFETAQVPDERGKTVERLLMTFERV